MKNKLILGISAFYHDSAAAIIKSGDILAAAQEERFSRIKHDPAFPSKAISFCLREANASLLDVDAIVFYDKPFLTFDRIIETYFSFAPRGFRSFLSSMPVWMKEKLFLKGALRRQLAEVADCSTKQLPPLLFTEHHQAHAASAFYPSPFNKAAVLCMDGVGEWATTSAWLGNGNQLNPLWQIDFPNSLGLLYSAFTYFCGFKVNSGEYKLMGLAPYGKPVYQQLIAERLIDIKADGSFKLNMRYFDYCTDNKMTSQAFEELFDGPPRAEETAITERELNLAASIQAITEDIVLKLATTIRNETGAEHLCLAGGVALNCTANGKLVNSGLFKHVWIQPAAGDAGGSIGAALAGWYHYYQAPRAAPEHDIMKGTYLGPEYCEQQIRDFLDNNNIVYSTMSETKLLSQVAALITQGHVIGWFQDKMEFGPRALGNRSIIADPRNPEMQSRLNLKIKFRESFRPFAPSVLEEKYQSYFDTETESPYMLNVAKLKQSQCLAESEKEMASKAGLDKLYSLRSTLPAVTHVDYSARLQTVSLKTNPKYHQLITEFEKLTGCPVLINTSFNIRGEPIVCSPDDAWRCFINTDMDYLILGNFLLDKKLQKKQATNRQHIRQFELD